jgi:hypothetical protein
MKHLKNISIAILVVYGVEMTFFANLKASESEKNATLAEEQRQEATKAAAEARKALAESELQRMAAVEARGEAVKQRELAVEALKNCK